MNLIADILQIYVVVLIVRALLSWFPVRSGTPLASVVRVVDTVTEPVLRPVRALIPPIRAGGMGIDVSFIIVVVALEVLIAVLHRL